jgi:hypothetical protein
MTPNDNDVYHDYHGDGVVGPINVLMREEAAKWVAWVEAWMDFFAGKPMVGDERFKPHLHLPFVVNHIVRHPVQKILGTDNILGWSSDFNINPLGTDICLTDRTGPLSIARSKP